MHNIMYIYITYKVIAGTLKCFRIKSITGHSQCKNKDAVTVTMLCCTYLLHVVEIGMLI